MEQNIEVYAKKGYALKGYALGGICLKGICLRGNMPNRFYALKGICLDTVKFYAKKGLCLKKLCPKGIMPYDSMPKYRQTEWPFGVKRSNLFCSWQDPQFVKSLKKNVL